MKFKLDFVGIGAEKAGTTWLADCLGDHPEIYIPRQKELFFFNKYDPHYLTVKNYRYKRGISWYKSQFRQSQPQTLKGEFSPTYIYDNEASFRIKKHFPDAKIIVILRNPVKRAFSQYIHDLRLGVIKEMTFEEAIKNYDNYVKKGLYFAYLQNYLRLFTKRNVLLLIYEDIQADPKKVIYNTYKFLGLKNLKFISSRLYKKSNEAAKAKFPALNYFMLQTEYFLRKNDLNFILKSFDALGVRKLAMFVRELNRSPLKAYPKLKDKTARQLLEIFEPDILKIEKLLRRDLKSWRLK